MLVGFEAKRIFANFTGLGNYSRFVVDALAHEYKDDQFLLYTPKLSTDPTVDKLRSLTNVEVRTPSKMISKLNLGSVWRSGILGNVAYKDGVDIFHGLSNELPFITNKKLRTVVTIHDLLFIRYPKHYGAFDVQIYHKKFRHACKVANRILAISEQTASDIQDFFGIEPEKIDVVYQGCDPRFVREYDPVDLEKIKVKYDLPDDFILHVGTVEPRKNALMILQALKILGKSMDLPLVIVGRPTPYKKVLQDYIRENKLSDQVRFLHYVDHKDLPLIYQLAMLFIYPSLFEGFGIPIVEALSSKVPVISSTGSCFSEAGGPDSIYVAPNQPEQLAHSITKVLGNASLAGEMAMKGFEYSQKFYPPQIAKKLMSVYEKVINHT